MHRPSSLCWPPLGPPLAPPPPCSPFLSQETPSGFEQKPDLSSLVCMLRWDVPGSLSRSLYSPFIPKHKYYLPRVFVCLCLPLFFVISLSVFLFLRLSLSCHIFLPLRPPTSTSMSPVDHQRASDVINYSLVILIDSWHCGRGWFARPWVSLSLLANFLI